MMLKSSFKRPLSTLAAVLLSASVLGLAANAPVMAQNAFGKNPISIEDLSRYEAVSGATLSPDGTKVAALLAVQGQKWPVISIWDANDLTKTPVWIPSATNRIVNVQFFGNDKIFFITEQEITRGDGRLSFTRKLYIADTLGKKIEEPFKMTGTKNKDVKEALERGISVGVFKDGLYDGNKVLLSKTNPTSLNTEIVEYDKVTGAMRKVAEETEKWGFVSAGVDLATGEPMIRQAVKVEDEGKFYLVTEVKNRQTGAWERHLGLGYKLEERTTLDVLGFDQDPNIVFVRTNRGGRNFVAIYTYDLRTKTFSDEPLFANDKFDISNIGLKQDYENKRFDYVSSITVGGPSTIQIILDEKWEPVQKAIQAAFPGKSVFLSINRKADKALVTVDHVDHPTAYYLYSNGKLAPLGSKRPWIKNENLGKGEYVTFKARDGLEIPALITYPPGYTPDKGRIPLVVHPHGGPWARDDQGWDDSGWVQFMATRGVAVIQPQYRGSDGWGDKLWKAGDGEWGQKMQDDKDDAAQYMVNRGIADPKRMAIFGYSYGGFAAIAASVRPNSPYNCAIAGAGVSSLDRLGNLWGDGLVQREVQGKTVDGMDPLKNVGKANIPIMLYHGDRDRQADYDHSVMFARAMKEAGNDVEFHTIKDMWHTLPWRYEWHKQTLTLIENYFKSPKCKIM